jgi:uncharacterized membrane protein
VSAAKLARALAATKVTLVVLCAARVATDLRRTSLGFEGQLASIILAGLVASLALAGLRWLSRRTHGRTR